MPFEGIYIFFYSQKDEDTVNSVHSSSSNIGGGDDPPLPISAFGLNGMMANANSAIVAPNPTPSGWLSVIRSEDEAGTIKPPKSLF
jgi:hypothetical protein